MWRASVIRRAPYRIMQTTTYRPGRARTPRPTKPAAETTLRPLFQALPSKLTFNWNSSLPVNPSSVRPENQVWNSWEVVRASAGHCPRRVFRCHARTGPHQSAWRADWDIIRLAIDTHAAWAAPISRVKDENPSLVADIGDPACSQHISKP